MNRHMIGVDPETHNRLNQMAVETNRSIVDMVRALVANAIIIKPDVTVEIDTDAEEDKDAA